MTITRALSPVLVGREAELSDLEDALLGALRGEGEVVLLSGDAGMGKTRLTAEFIRRAEKVGCLVMSGGCSEAELSLPYLPFVEAVGNHLATIDVAALRSALAGAADELGQLFPQLAAAPVARVDDPTQARMRLFEAMLTLLRVSAGSRALVLVVEDVHWADPSTRELLDYFVRRVRTTNVVLLTTYRADEISRRHPLRPLVTGWRRTGQVRSIELGPIGPDDLARMVAAIFDGEEVTGEFRDFLHARTEGNPFVLEEMLKAAVDRGDIYRTESGWDRRPLEDVKLPPSVRDSILVRLERLEESEADVLRAASVLGRSFSHAAIAQMTGEADAAIAALEVCILNQLLDEDGSGYRFRHALTQEAVYESMATPRRQRLHSRVADIGAANPSTPAADVTHHLLAAGRYAEAVPVGLRAAADAEARLAYGDAAAIYERLLPHVAEGLEAARLEARLGTSQWLGARPALARASLEDAATRLEALGERTEAARHRITLGRAFWELAKPERARQEYEAARDTLEPLGPSSDLAQAYVRLSGMSTFDLDSEAAESYAQRAIDVAEACGADDMRIWAYNFLGCAILIGRGSTDEGFDYLDRSYREAKERGLTYIGSNALFNDTWSRVHHEGLPGAELRLTRMVEGPRGSIEDVSIAYLRAVVRWATGHLREAASAAEEAVALAEQSGYLKLVWRARVVQASALVELGRLDEAQSTLPPIDTRLDLQDLVYDTHARMRLALARGDSEAIRDVALSVVSAGSQLGVFTRVVMLTVEGLLAIEMPDEAEALLAAGGDRLKAEDSAFASVARGLLARHRGEVDAAVGLLRDGARRLEAMGHRVEAARARLSLAEALAHADPDSARGEFDLATQVAVDCGAGLLLDRLAAAGRPLGFELNLPEQLTSPAAVPEISGERLVSVMFADVRGYTAMTRAEHPAEMVDRISSLQRWAVHEVERHGGLVDKFAGDAVMATFNVAGNSVDHTLRALQTAIALRDKAALADLSLGLGIAVGPAVVGRLSPGANVSVLGETTNLAARLQAAAGGGEILLTEEAYRRVSDWLLEHELTTEHRELELKGIDQPVPAHALPAAALVAPGV